MSIPKCDFCGDTREVFDEELGLCKVCPRCSCNTESSVAFCPARNVAFPTQRFFQQVADASCSSGHEQW